MIDFKEVVKWLKRNGKYHITWERSEQYNYLTNGSVLIKIPRYEAAINSGNDMNAFYTEKEKEELLVCERVLLYHFMQTPMDGERIQKAGNSVQMVLKDTSYEELLLTQDTEMIQDTGLINVVNESMFRVFAIDGGYIYYNNGYIAMIQKEGALYQATGSRALIHKTEYSGILIMPIKSEDNIFLKRNNIDQNEEAQ